MDSERSERIRYFGFAAFVGALLLLYVLGYFKTVFGIEIAAIIAVLAGYRIFFNAIPALLEKTISADLAICIAVIAAFIVGESAAAGRPCSSCWSAKASSHTPPGGPPPHRRCTGT